MRISPVSHRPVRPLAEIRMLAATCLLFVGLLVFLNACGTDDLVFPGNIPATSTPANTATPVPTEI